MSINETKVSLLSSLLRNGDFEADLYGRLAIRSTPDAITVRWGGTPRDVATFERDNTTEAARFVVTKLSL